MGQGEPSRADLYRVIAQLRAEVARLVARVEELEAELAGRGPPPPRPPAWVRPSKPARPGERQVRKKRAANFARRRAVADRQVEHAVATCPDCGCGLRGGTIKRRREVIDVELRPAVVTEHVLLERVCPVCDRACVPVLGPADGVVGRHRFGPNLLALIGTWREVGRLPARAIQAFLGICDRVHVSLGAVEGALHALAARGAAAVATLREQIRAAPVVHADETTWRQDGRNGYVWQLSTPTACYFERGPRTTEQIDRLLGREFAGVLVSDFYAAYHHFPGEKQRCWAHLLRDVREVLAAHPADAALRRWGRYLHRLFRATRDHPGTTPAERRRIRQRAEASLTRACQPWTQASVPQRTLCQRIMAHRHELFTFVVRPEVPPTNNAAERAFRPLVIARKVWGGTRSEQGSTDAMRRASLVATWRLRALNPFDQFRTLLLSPQL